MNLRKEIINKLKYSFKDDRYVLNSTECESYVINTGGEIGVIVPLIEYKSIYETFNKIVLKSIQLSDGKWYLALLIKETMAVEEFSLICVDFVEGNVSRRSEILDNPLQWWNKWRELLGNKKYEEKVYYLLGELMTYYYYKGKDDSVTWSGDEYGTHDIEANDYSVEVKSTSKKYGTDITVSSQYQFVSNNKPLYLMHYRFEKSKEGISVNQMINKFDCVKSQLIRDKLENLGYMLSNHIFDIRYKVLEIKLFDVNDEFPVLDINKYTDENLKMRLKSLQYQVNLDGIEHEVISKDFLKV